jgi:hypothetical protein
MNYPAMPCVIGAATNMIDSRCVRSGQRGDAAGFSRLSGLALSARCCRPVPINSELLAPVIRFPILDSSGAFGAIDMTRAEIARVLNSPEHLLTRSWLAHPSTIKKLKPFLLTAVFQGDTV